MRCCIVVAQLLLTEEKNKERPPNVDDDEDGHLIYNDNDVIRKQCEHRTPATPDTISLLNAIKSSKLHACVITDVDQLH